jgi:hypothetical protein
MKTYINIFLALFISVTAFSQNTAIDKYFSAYENNEEFTVVFVSPKMFNMIATATKDGKSDVADLVKDIKGLKILTTEKNAGKYYAEALKKIPTTEYEVLMTVKDKGENVKFLTKGSGDVVDELLLLVGGGDKFVLMSFVGKLDLNKISKLANKLDIQGGEHLDKLKNKK